MHRIPVIYKNKQLMPMKSSRAKKFVETKQAVICYNRKLKLHYLKLLRLPSDFNLQDMALGLDPGSWFDGFSVVSKRTHHCNFELIHRSKKGKDSISAFKKRQAANRRIRRSRLWHRPAKFDNRTSKKLTPTIRSNVDFRIWFIKEISKIYPISKVVVEDVKYKHDKKQKKKFSEAAFSLVEQGKTALYQFISSKFELQLMDGYRTHELRKQIFGHDPKISDKGCRKFEAHCIDSFVIALNGIETNEEILIKINRDVWYIEKILRIRRCLTRLRPAGYKGKNSYYWMRPGGIRENYQKISKKRNLCRIKPPGVIKSNHPKTWIYLDHGFADRSKYQEQKFGGTKIEQKFINNEFANRLISHT